MAKYRSMGDDGLSARSSNTRYPHALKIAARNAFLVGEGSLLAICERFRVRSEPNVVGLSSMMVNNGPKPNRSNERNFMSKGHKTASEEWIAIIADCIESGRDYGLIAGEHRVSYHQLYSWVKKYDKYGFDGLDDRREGGREKRTLLWSDSGLRTGFLNRKPRRWIWRICMTPMEYRCYLLGRET